MSCCHGYAIGAGETAFTVDTSAVTFGPGALGEAGAHARALGCRRVALFTDQRLAKLEHVAVAIRSIRQAGIEVAVYDEVHVEPTDASFAHAAAFARGGAFDGYVSVGGGSVIDTCKAALLYATYPADLLAYVNKPIGEARVSDEAKGPRRLSIVDDEEPPPSVMRASIMQARRAAAPYLTATRIAVAHLARDRAARFGGLVLAVGILIGSS